MDVKFLNIKIVNIPKLNTSVENEICAQNDRNALFVLDAHNFVNLCYNNGKVMLFLMVEDYYARG